MRESIGCKFLLSSRVCALGLAVSASLAMYSVILAVATQDARQRANIEGPCARRCSRLIAALSDALSLVPLDHAEIMALAFFPHTQEGRPQSFTVASLHLKCAHLQCGATFCDGKPTYSCSRCHMIK